jgi:YesN/AraC family two-component response regulator
MKLLAQQGLVNRDGPALSPTILVVDDEVDTLRLHTHLIRQHLPHVRVLEAENGRAALDLMLRRPPDLVLLDLMMPELDGFGVLEAMQSYASLRAIPVIILTGQVLPEEVMLRLNRCVAGILGKGIFSVDETLKQIVSSLARDRRLGSEAQRIARRTLGYIHTHYANPLSRSDIAAHLGINERYLTHCFRQEVGITPMEYLNRYRVKIAKTLLETESNSITDIGLKVGFSSSAHFSRVFRRHAGVSPRGYLHAKA